MTEEQTPESETPATPQQAPEVGTPEAVAPEASAPEPSPVAPEAVAPEVVAPEAPSAASEPEVSETAPTVPALEIPAAPMPSDQPKDPSLATPGGYYWGTGRRKTAVARVRIRPGSGEFKVNKKDADEHFCRDVDRQAIRAPLQAADMLKKLDVFVNISGGGTTGQAGAIVLGIARAINRYDTQYEQVLRDGGYLTRDSRRVERKKYGQRGARRRFQFSKR